MGHAEVLVQTPTPSVSKFTLFSGSTLNIWDFFNMLFYQKRVKGEGIFMHSLQSRNTFKKKKILSQITANYQRQYVEIPL